MARDAKKLRPLVAGGMALALVATAVVATGAVRASSGNANPNSHGYTISGNTPGFIKKGTDLGAVDPATQITVTAWLKLHNENKLDQLVHDQYTKGSSNYHKFLSQSQFNAQFSPTTQEVNAVEHFLTAHHLSVVTVAENNWYVKVQGSVGDIEKAFHVQLDNYKVNGQTYRSNTADPNINDPAGGLVAAVSGLDDFGFSPTLVRPQTPEGTPVQNVPLSKSPNGAFFAADCFTGTETHSFTSAGGTKATYNGNRYGTPIDSNTLGELPPCGYQPSDLQTAYNMTPLYQAGLTGKGQTVVITDAFGAPYIAQDAETFSQIYGLPDITSSNFHVIRAPGAVNNPVDNGHIGTADGWAGEVTLDVEWVHAMAPDATIDLVIGPNNTADLDEAVNYAVVHHLGNTISNSWSSIEGFGNPAQFNRDNRILEQAAAEGIDVNFSSGDSGDFAAEVGFRTVGFPGSSPYATAIGGTSLALNSDHTIAFQTGWGNNITKIAGTTGSGSPAVIPPLVEGFIYGAGGGTSLTFPKPAFQSGLSGSMRMVPDISMVADPYTGVEIIQTVNTSSGPETTVGVIGGTSLACPVFSAIMAIASEKAGHGFGQVAPLVYGLSSSPDTANALYDVQSYTSSTNVSGSDSAGDTFSADDLAGPHTNPYYSAFYNSPFSTNFFVLTFGTDSSLSTGNGWDNVTGVGTPNGANFVNALAGL